MKPSRRAKELVGRVTYKSVGRILYQLYITLKDFYSSHFSANAVGIIGVNLNSWDTSLKYTP